MYTSFRSAAVQPRNVSDEPSSRSGRYILAVPPGMTYFAELVDGSALRCMNHSCPLFGAEVVPSYVLVPYMRTPSRTFPFVIEMPPLPEIGPQNSCHPKSVTPLESDARNVYPSRISTGPYQCDGAPDDVDDM